MTSPLDKIYAVVDQLKSSGAYKNYKTISSPQGSWLNVDGKKVLNLCSNNYLGLASHPQVTKAAIKAVQE